MATCVSPSNPLRSRATFFSPAPTPAAAVISGSTNRSLWRALNRTPTWPPSATVPFPSPPFSSTTRTLRRSIIFRIGKNCWNFPQDPRYRHRLSSRQKPLSDRRGLPTGGRDLFESCAGALGVESFYHSSASIKADVDSRAIHGPTTERQESFGNGLDCRNWFLHRASAGGRRRVGRGQWKNPKPRGFRHRRNPQNSSGRRRLRHRFRRFES